MKNLAIYSLVFLLSLGSCKKEVVSEANNSLLIGDWEWVQSSGGIMGTSFGPTDVGYTRKISFTADGKYSIYKAEKLERSGKYELTKTKSIYSTELADAIVFDNGMVSIIQSQTVDKLKLADNFQDGFEETYQKGKK